MSQKLLGTFRTQFIEELNLSIDLPTYEQDLQRPLAEESNSIDPERTANDTANADCNQTNELSSCQRFGRYRVIDILGKGSFGTVYRAYDQELDRKVALKVIQSRTVETKLRDRFVSEARVVAALDHKSIVPVFDVGQSDAGDFYIESKLIEGANLQEWLEQSRPTEKVSLFWCYTIAAALDHAHACGLVHRDVKPANILIGVKGSAFLTDFGIALRNKEESSSRYVGTPAYMSPEQARGESHRVDQRSDIFSLGVVLFELFAGRRPVECDDYVELMRCIGSQPAPLLSYFVENAPPAVVRICEKALAYRANERYQTAAEMAQELRNLLTQDSGGKASQYESSESEGVSPKGLRSFDSIDSQAYLELIPGSRSSDGTPDNIRRWQSRILSANLSFPIGLLYGPSGCGKSSFVKAGLIPSLPSEVLPIFIEASSDSTEKRLKTSIANCLEFPIGEMSLPEMFSMIREGKLLPSGKQLLIVIDQFEQWLHARQGAFESELSAALRHCDGKQLVGLLLIRDDFWLSINRFFRDLEIEISPQNSELFDLFDVSHAKKVLGLFGKALGKLPMQQVKWTEAQHYFLASAIEGLAIENKVSSVRLALFAELFKSRAWTKEALAIVCGGAGIGMTFLRESFDTPVSPAVNRKFREAAMGILRALLPSEGTEIKGHSRNIKSLALASGLKPESDEFRCLLHLLDRELRLITPTDAIELPEVKRDTLGPVSARQHGRKQPENIRKQAPKGMPNSVTECEYQLAHDYLVPSLRKWLSASLKKSSKGRLQLLLSERSVIWANRREDRHLPSLWEYVRIRIATKKRLWTEDEQAMMNTKWKRISLFQLFFPLNLLAIGVSCVGLYFQQDSMFRVLEQQYQSLETLHYTLEELRLFATNAIHGRIWQIEYALVFIAIFALYLFFRISTKKRKATFIRIVSVLGYLILIAIQLVSLLLISLVFIASSGHW